MPLTAFPDHHTLIAGCLFANCVIAACLIASRQMAGRRHGFRPVFSRLICNRHRLICIALLPFELVLGRLGEFGLPSSIGLSLVDVGEDQGKDVGIPLHRFAVDAVLDILSDLVSNTLVHCQ